MLAAFFALIAAYAGVAGQVAELSPREKAALLVVSSPPAPRGVAGVLLHPWEIGEQRPRRALVFVDQEGGPVRAYPGLPPERSAAAYTSSGQAFAAGKKTALALRGEGVHVDLAPVLDSPDGPLGGPPFGQPALAGGVARGGG